MATSSTIITIETVLKLKRAITMLITARIIAPAHPHFLCVQRPQPVAKSAAPRTILKIRMPTPDKTNSRPVSTDMTPAMNSRTAIIVTAVGLPGKGEGYPSGSDGYGLGCREDC